jgi:hypothetical protein
MTSWFPLRTPGRSRAPLLSGTAMAVLLAAWGAAPSRAAQAAYALSPSSVPAGQAFDLKLLGGTLVVTHTLSLRMSGFPWTGRRREP